MRGASVGKILVAVSSMVLAVSGCRCGPEPVVCGDVVVTFDTPVDGATVSKMISVSASVKNTAGDPIALASARIQTRTAAATDFSDAVGGTVALGKATFGSVSLPVGTNLIKVTAVQSSPTCEGSRTITVTVPNDNMPGDPPDVTAFKIVEDANNDGTLNGAELAVGAIPHAQIAVLRDTNCTVEVRDAAGMPIYGAAVPLVSGMATVELTNLPTMDTSGIGLEAFVQCTDGRIHAVASDAEAHITLKIKRTSTATCGISEPTKALLGPADVMLPDGGAHLLTVGTTMNAVTGHITIESDAGVVSSIDGPTMQDSITNDFAIANSGERPYKITVTAVDSDGNPCAPASTNTVVDLEKPVVNITSPVATGSYTTSFNIPISVTVTGAEGQDVICSSSLGAIGGPFTVVNGVASGTGSFVNGMQTISCYVIDAAGNRSDTDTENITVAATACPLTWVKPTVTPAYLTRNDGLVSGTPETLQYELRVQTDTTAICLGQTISIFHVSGATRTVVGTPGLPNAGGVYAITVNLPDTNGAAERYEAQITNITPTMPTVASVNIAVQLTTPVISLPAAGTLGVIQDANASLAGVQRSLTVIPTLPTNGTLTICSNVMLAGSPGPCPDGAAGWYIMPGGNALTSVSVSSFTFPDGSYSVKPVFVVGAVVNAGTALAYVVDSTRPVVVTATLAGDANNDKTLNLAESPSGDPTLNITVTGAANGSTVTVVNVATGATIGAQTTIANGAASVPLALSLAATADQAFNIEVRVVEQPSGNTNNQTGATAANAINPAAFVSFRVDRVPPTCSVTSPNRAQLGVADDASGNAGYQLRGTVQTSSDVGPSGVVMTLTGGSAPATFTGGPASGGSTVTNDFTVAGTGTVNYSLAVSCTDSAGNAVNAAAVAVIVDNDPPTGCAITSPTAANSPYTATRVLPITVTASNANGLTAVVTTLINGQTAPQQLATIPISAGTGTAAAVSFPNGDQVVTATITDAAGNSCAPSQSITVNATTCNIVPTAPASSAFTLNADNGTVAGSNLTWTLAGTANNCAGVTVTLYSGTGSSRVQVGTTTAAAGTGAFSFSVTTAEGTAHYEIEMNNGTASTFPLDVTVDVTPPVLGAVTPSAPALTYVAQGNHNVNLGTAGYIVDADPATPGAQGTVTVTHSADVGGKIEVLYNAAVVASIGPITASTPNPASLAITLPQSTTGSLVIRVSDAAGNHVDSTKTATVDVIAPTEPTLTVSVTAGQERTAQLGATFTASGDDGTSGTVTGYDVRWTTALIAPTGLATSADFFDSAKAWPDSNGATTTRSITVPPLNSYYVYVRAFDEVGNYSALVAATKVDNLGTKVTIPNPRTGAQTTDYFGVMMSSKGSINNDTFDDLVIGFDSTTGNRIYIHYGSAGGIGTMPQEIVGTTIPIVGTGNFITTSFGRGVAVGKVSDSGKGDVLVAAPSVLSNTGNATLFFGTNAAQLDTSAGNLVQFQGVAAGAFMGRALAIIDDINGDAYDDILITATGEGSNRGRVYLYYGRTVAQWRALAGCATACAPITTAQADRSFWGPNPADTSLGFGLFGRRGTGFTNVGKPGSGTQSDFTIPASYESYNRSFIFSGATVNAAPAATTFFTAVPGRITDPDQSLQALGANSNVNNREGGFGVSATGNINLVGASASDLVLGFATTNSVLVFGDRTATGFAAYGSQTYTLAGPANSNFGWANKVVDFTGDSKGDILVGSYSAQLAQTATGVWLFQNRGGMTEFDANASTGFFVSRLFPLTAGSGLGSALAVGDFNGDGKSDFAAADHLDGVGKVFVWQ